MIFFTSDTHFCHENIIKYSFRPFNSVKDMNNAIISNWNRVVQKDDIVFHLGDVMLTNNQKEIKTILDALSGTMILIVGDHDKSVLNQYPKRFKSIHSLYQYKEQAKGEKHPSLCISLCHYCLRVWPKSHYGSYHLYGHSHGHLPSEGKSHDVGVDNNNFTPVSLDQIKEIMKTKPDNFNLIKPDKRPEQLLEQLSIPFNWENKTPC